MPVSPSFRLRVQKGSGDGTDGARCKVQAIFNEVGYDRGLERSDWFVGTKSDCHAPLTNFLMLHGKSVARLHGRRVVMLLWKSIAMLHWRRVVMLHWRIIAMLRWRSIAAVHLKKWLSCSILKKHCNRYVFPEPYLAIYSSTCTTRKSSTVARSPVSDTEIFLVPPKSGPSRRRYAD